MREMAPAAARRRGVDGAAVLRQSFAKHYGGGGGVGEGEGGNQRPRTQGMKSLLSPTIYRRAKGGVAGPRRSNLPGPAPPLGAYIKEGKGEGSRTLELGASPLLHLVLLP